MGAEKTKVLYQKIVLKQEHVLGTLIEGHFYIKLLEIQPKHKPSFRKFIKELSLYSAITSEHPVEWVDVRLDISQIDEYENKEYISPNISGYLEILIDEKEADSIQGLGFTPLSEKDGKIRFSKGIIVSFGIDLNN